MQYLSTTRPTSRVSSATRCGSLPSDTTSTLPSLDTAVGYACCLSVHITIIISTSLVIASTVLASSFILSNSIYLCLTFSPALDNIWVMVIFWRLRGNIIRTALCWIVWHNVHSPQHTYMTSSYRSDRLGLSHWDPYAVCRGGCLELYYCNMVEWFWWDSSLISTTNWFPSVLRHCWFGHLACKNRPWNDL